MRPSFFPFPISHFLHPFHSIIFPFSLFLFPFPFPFPIPFHPRIFHFSLFLFPFPIPFHPRIFHFSLFLFPFLTLLTSCGEGDIIPPTSPQLVIEGHVEDGQCPVVQLTTTLPLNTHYQSLDSIANHIVRHATVQVSDGQQSVYLTGRYRNSSDYTFPFEYTTGALVCHAGQSYRLIVDYADFHAEATTTIPPQAQLQQLQAVEVSDPSAKQKSYKLVATPAQDDTGATRFFIRMEGTGGDFVLTSHSTLPSGQMEVFRPLMQGIEGMDNYFHSGEEVQVRYAALTPEGETFWASYEELLILSRNFLMPVTHNLASNITGATGIWTGYGSSYYRLTLP